MRTDHTVCPFCGAASAATSRPHATIASRLTRASIFAGAALASGCHPTSPPPTQTAALPAPPGPQDAAPVSYDASVPLDAPVPIDAPMPVDAAVAAVVDAGPTTPVATTGSIRGQILDMNSRALRNVKITVQLESGEKPLGSTRSDRNGYYRFEKLAAGIYVLTYTGLPRKQFTAPRTLHVIPGREVVENVLLEPVVPQKPNTCCMPYGAPPSRRRVV